MLNKTLVSNKYSSLVPQDKDRFIEEVKFIKSNINLSSLNDKPVLCYSKNRRNAICYVLAYYNSLKQDKILTYHIMTGQTLNSQYFLSEENRDKAYDDIFYTDIAFISLSQFDYTNEFIEALIIDLIEFRERSGRLTVVLYDVLDSGKSTYRTYTRNLQAYFIANNFQIIDIAENIGTIYSGSTVFDKPGRPTKVKKGGRIE